MKIRQVAPTLSGIREDHRFRYQFAIQHATLHKCTHVTDIGCGVGYGAYMMALQGLKVFACDRDAETIEYARKHYSHANVEFQQLELADLPNLPLARVKHPGGYRMITAFEIIEHTPIAPEVLRRLLPTHMLLVGSVPNENVVPFANGGYNTEHYRHYKPEEIRKTINDLEWSVTFLGSQKGKRGTNALVRSEVTGRTLVFVAEKKAPL